MVSAQQEPRSRRRTPRGGGPRFDEASFDPGEAVGGDLLEELEAEAEAERWADPEEPDDGPLSPLSQAEEAQRDRLCQRLAEWSDLPRREEQTFQLGQILRELRPLWRRDDQPLGLLRYAAEVTGIFNPERLRRILLLPLIYTRDEYIEDTRRHSVDLAVTLEIVAAGAAMKPVLRRAAQRGEPAGVVSAMAVAIDKEFERDRRKATLEALESRLGRVGRLHKLSQVGGCKACGQQRRERPRSGAAASAAPAMADEATTASAPEVAPARPPAERAALDAEHSALQHKAAALEERERAASAREIELLRRIEQLQGSEQVVYDLEAELAERERALDPALHSRMSERRAELREQEGALALQAAQLKAERASLNEAAALLATQQQEHGAAVAALQQNIEAERGRDEALAQAEARLSAAQEEAESKLRSALEQAELAQRCLQEAQVLEEQIKQRDLLCAAIVQGQIQRDAEYLLSDKQLEVRQALLDEEENRLLAFEKQFLAYIIDHRVQRWPILPSSVGAAVIEMRDMFERMGEIATHAVERLQRKGNQSLQRGEIGGLLSLREWLDRISEYLRQTSIPKHVEEFIFRHGEGALVAEMRIIDAERARPWEERAGRPLAVDPRTLPLQRLNPNLPTRTIFNTTRKTSAQVGLIGRTRDGSRGMLLNLDDPFMMMATGLFGTGKTSFLQSIAEMARGSLRNISQIKRALSFLFCTWGSSLSAPPPAILSGLMPNDEAHAQPHLLSLGAQATAMNNLVAWVPPMSEEEFAQRKSEYSELGIRCRQFKPTLQNLGAHQMLAFMSAALSQSQYVHRFVAIAREMPPAAPIEELWLRVRAAGFSAGELRLLEERAVHLRRYLGEEDLTPAFQQEGVGHVMDLRANGMTAQEALVVTLAAAELLTGRPDEKGRRAPTMVLVDEGHKTFGRGALLEQQALPRMSENRHMNQRWVFNAPDPHQLHPELLRLVTVGVHFRTQGEAAVESLRRLSPAMASVTKAQMAALPDGTAKVWADRKSSEEGDTEAEEVLVRPTLSKPGGTTKRESDLEE